MRTPLTAKAWAALITVYLVWGSTYLAIAYVVDSLPPLLAGGARWTTASLVMLAFGLRKGSDADPITRTHWRNAAIIGVALCLGGNGLVSIAEERVSSGMAALLIATVPLFVAALDRLARGTRLTSLATAGLFIGFAGAAILVWPRNGEATVDPLGTVLLLGASLSWAAGTTFAGHAALPKRPLVATGMEMFCGGIALALVGLVRGEAGHLDLDAVRTSSVVALLYLIVFGSLIAFTSYVWLVRNIPNSIATTYAYVNPLVAVALGWALRDERFDLTTLAGGIVIVVAVAMIVRFGQPAKARRDEQVDLASEELPV